MFQKVQFGYFKYLIIVTFFLIVGLLFLKKSKKDSRFSLNYSNFILVWRKLQNKLGLVIVRVFIFII